ncbi:hypothetical protein [Zavarzinella formosa]|uniref:hypothetical protein n=1 Tax=Zavarzinella formosa TaxID=360055 RepID=UPI0003071774|nr:hypothetical protein [Zavarzinella formosa]
MRINPYSSQPPVDSVTSGTNSAKSKPASTSVTETSETDGFSRSSALSGLIGSLRDLPDVRSDVLAGVQAKIDAGQLTTSSAYAEAAANIDDSAKG